MNWATDTARFLADLVEEFRKHRARKKRKRKYPVSYTDRVKDAQREDDKGPRGKGGA